MQHDPWRALFSEVERVYIETAKVLREADGLLDHAGFDRPDGENAVERQVSASPSNPSWWFPGWLGRFYVPRATGATPQLLYVAVYLYNRKGDDAHKPDEAVIAGGVWRFIKTPPKTYPSWLAKGWAWGPKAEPYGVVGERTVNGHGCDAKGRCVGVALSTVTSPESLSQHVIEPLVKIASETW
jgi:hypothetical protein